ncbi:hypothetical protein [Wolbachia endosymbiont (group B) of Schoenobius gigantella]|uniref:hypothetical protein n=1 Tax=Wolbachia endosymbiont (group B) of Schoenobius gigantella TaxID=3139313 RepID=UPI003CCB633B
MKTPKLLKGVAKKFKNRKGSTIATTAKGAAIEESRTSNNMPADVEEVKVEVKEQTNVDKATETDTQLCNENSEIEQPIFESSERAQNSSIETTVEPTSVNRETDKQEPNAPEGTSSAEPCFDATDEKDKPLTQQRQAILASVVGAVLLVGSVVFYTLKIDVTVAVVVGIVGLACIGLALYNIINLNTKLEKVEEQSITAHPPLNPT